MFNPVEAEGEALGDDEGEAEAEGERLLDALLEAEAEGDADFEGELLGLGEELALADGDCEALWEMEAL